MEVPTLTAKDAKATLSRKSPMPKKSVRKALKSPYETVRPICTNVTEMEEIMRRLLAPAKRRGKRIPWAEFKKMSEEERKRAKAALKRKDKSNVIRKQLVCGTNEVMTAIEKHTISSAVVSDDILPTFMMNLIIDSATVHNVPVIIFPKLRKLMMDTLGHNCACFGIKIKGSCHENSHFYQMHQKIVEIAKKYQFPEETILCCCPSNEPTSFHQLLTCTDDPNLKESDDPNLKESDDPNLKEPDAEGLDYKSDLEEDSTWLCAQPTPEGNWKTKHKLRKELSQQLGKEDRGDSKGRQCSALAGEKLPELDGGKESSEVLAGATHRRKGSASHSYRKISEARPYSRSFLKKLSVQKAKKQKHTPSAAESEDECDNEKQAKKRKKNIDAQDEREIPEVISEAKLEAEVPTTAVEKPEDFQYLIQSGKKRIFTLGQYRPLKLTEN